jgi:hypothetical protein
MNILFKEAYWGALIILVGLLLILRNVFKIEVPVFGIIVPIIIITLGISLLIGFRERHTDNSTVFGQGQVVADSSESSYSVVFGKGEYDLRSLRPTDKNIPIEVNAVFSDVKVRIKQNTPIRIKLESAFAGGKVPSGKVAAFGDRSFVTNAFNENSPFIDLKATVVFGNLDIIEDPSESF